MVGGILGILTLIGIIIIIIQSNLATHHAAAQDIINTGPHSATFTAKSPWHVQITGTHCSVAVRTPSGGLVRNLLGDNYKMQMRVSGTFYLQGDVKGHGGCNAVPKRGAGGTASLPLTIPPGANDSLPFSTSFERLPGHPP
jgi:hypothetical protein